MLNFNKSYQIKRFNRLIEKLRLNNQLRNNYDYLTSIDEKPAGKEFCDARNVPNDKGGKGCTSAAKDTDSGTLKREYESKAQYYLDSANNQTDKKLREKILLEREDYINRLIN